MSHIEKFRSEKDLNNSQNKRTRRQEKLLLLNEDKDRFNTMRKIQTKTHRFKQYYALIVVVLAFSIIFSLGTLGFMLAERREQDLSYLDALYFCCISLPAVGYGDTRLRSNIGKPFFIVWSFLAVSILTILISDVVDTILVAIINCGTRISNNLMVLPREGVWHDFLLHKPRLRNWIQG
jgi:potassium channel subfamily K